MIKYRNAALKYGNPVQPDPDLEVFDYSKLEANGYGSRTTIWRKVRAGKFPKPTYIGDRPVWSRAQLLELHGLGTMEAV